MTSYTKTMLRNRQDQNSKALGLYSCFRRGAMPGLGVLSLAQKGLGFRV